MSTKGTISIMMETIAVPMLLNKTYGNAGGERYDGGD
jgi:hypothetical protein